MRVLSQVTPTPEQLAIISRNRPGIEIIRGAAGSGKTTTALLRLRSLIGMFISRRDRSGDEEPVRALILTYNRTLRGYIEALAVAQGQTGPRLELTISTFARWARRKLGNPKMISARDRSRLINDLGKKVDLSSDFLLEEVEYVMGRYLPDNIDEYINARRHGRGTAPRMERSMRRALLDKVIKPYQKYIDKENLWDWNDLAVNLADDQYNPRYDIVIADETQDFSANQVRAIKN